MPTVLGTPPATTVRWADSANGHPAVVTEPTELQKDTGWVGTQKPPAAVFNWWQNLIAAAVNYLYGAVTGLNTGKLEKDGSNEMNGNLNPATANLYHIGNVKRWATLNVRDITVHNSVFTESLDVTDPNATIKGSLIPVLNAEPLGSTTKRWSAFLSDLNLSGFIANNLVPNVDNTFTLGNSTNRFSAFLRVITCYDYLGLDSSDNPAKTTAIKNQLSKVNLPKAWGYVKYSAGALDDWDGFNIASVSATVTNVSGQSEITITLAQDMVDGDYCVVASLYNVDTDDSQPCAAKSLSAGSFILKVGGGSVETLDTRFSFQVFGRQ